MWATKKICDLSNDSLMALIRNEIPAVQIDDFARPAEIKSLKQTLLDQSRRTHSIKQVTRLGISQYAQGICQSKANYFHLVPGVMKELAEAFRSSFDPLSRFITSLSSSGFDAGVMQEPGFGSYAPCAGKLRNGFSPIHVDFAAQDSADWEVGAAPVQLAWNLYLDMPAIGGELMLWDRQWQPEIDRYLVRDNYYYEDAVVADLEPLRIRPIDGQLLVLNSRNFHAVDQVSDRLTIGGFISYFPEKSLRLWI
jgi:hypothetical protein